MSTSAKFAIKEKNTINYFYHHTDGYPEGILTGLILDFIRKRLKSDHFRSSMVSFLNSQFSGRLEMTDSKASFSHYYDYLIDLNRELIFITSHYTDDFHNTEYTFAEYINKFIDLDILGEYLTKEEKNVKKLAVTYFKTSTSTKINTLTYNLIERQEEAKKELEDELKEKPSANRDYAIKTLTQELEDIKNTLDNL